MNDITNSTTIYQRDCVILCLILCIKWVLTDVAQTDVYFLSNQTVDEGMMSCINHASQ